MSTTLSRCKHKEGVEWRKRRQEAATSIMRSLHDHHAPLRHSRYHHSLGWMREALVGTRTVHSSDAGLIHATYLSAKHVQSTATRSMNAANAFTTTLQPTRQDIGRSRNPAAHPSSSQNQRSTQQCKHRHRVSRYLTKCTAFQPNSQQATVVQRQSTTWRLSNQPTNKEVLEAAPNDNQAGSPPTCAIVSGALVACWRGHSGIQAAATS